VKRDAGGVVGGVMPEELRRLTSFSASVFDGGEPGGVVCAAADEPVVADKVVDETDGAGGGSGL
jgi:hypothetical protein